MTTEASSRNSRSSATAAHSFALDGSPPNLKLKALKLRRDTLQADLTALEATPIPEPALYKKVRAQSIARYKSSIRDHDEAIAYEEKQAKA